ncbi:MAG: hypothetical protein NVSMB25_18880 [Thermoleophilaceae bacterium]
MQFLVIMFFFGLASAVVGKIKGSSFMLWMLIGFALPVFGLLAAVLYRFERHELRRRCEECGAVVPISDQVCTRCGRDLAFPEEALLPAGAPVPR